MSTPEPIVQPAPRQVHLALNPKGGVGKSLISIFVSQFLKSKGDPVLCFDADATTATFSGFKALDVKRIEMRDGQTIDERRLDEVMDPLLNENAHIILDTGASTYTVFANYLIENDVIPTIEANGKEVVVHAIVTGGASLIETLSDFKDLAAQLPESVMLVVWKNEHFGPIIAPNGKAFEQMAVYEAYHHRIHAIIHLPQRTVATFGADVTDMMKRQQTFDEAINDPETRLMAKQRLTLVRRDVFNQLQAAL
ncbi:MAG: conjugal transfer protein TraL [Alphaproteobacteria bacterium]